MKTYVVSGLTSIIEAEGDDDTIADIELSTLKGSDNMAEVNLTKAREKAINIINSDDWTVFALNKVNTWEG